MSEGDRSKSLFVLIVIPLVTFFGGMTAQYAIANRNVAQQEFSTATAIASNELAQKNDKLKEWAELVIAQGIAEKKRDLPTQHLPPSSPDYFIVSRAIVDDVCLFPMKYLEEPYGKNIMDTVENDPKSLIGKDVRILFMRSVADYRALRNQYEMVHHILKDYCGFLLRR